MPGASIIQIEIDAAMQVTDVNVKGRTDRPDPRWRNADMTQRKGPDHFSVISHPCRAPKT